VDNPQVLFPKVKIAEVSHLSFFATEVIASSSIRSRLHVRSQSYEAQRLRFEVRLLNRDFR